jgi:hypothetical protein
MSTLSSEGLIKNKKAVGRAKDLRLLPELQALLEIRKSETKSEAEFFMEEDRYDFSPGEQVGDY